jgi:hypothetical protein
MSVCLPVVSLSATPTPHPTLTGAPGCCFPAASSYYYTVCRVVMVTYATQRRSTPASRSHSAATQYKLHVEMVGT